MSEQILKDILKIMYKFLVFCSVIFTCSSFLCLVYNSTFERISKIEEKIYDISDNQADITIIENSVDLLKLSLYDTNQRVEAIERRINKKTKSN